MSEGLVIALIVIVVFVLGSIVFAAATNDPDEDEHYGKGGDYL